MIAALGLGSNLGSAQDNVDTAINHLGKLGTLLARSHLYGSKPWGILEQPDFCNAAILLDVTISARELLHAIKTIETRMGRTPTVPWGPRLIDIDILTMGELKLNEPDLVIPHPHMNQRAFVLIPLAEIMPEFQLQMNALPVEERNQVWRLDASENGSCR